MGRQGRHFCSTIGVREEMIRTVPVRIACGRKIDDESVLYLRFRWHTGFAGILQRTAAALIPLSLHHRGVMHWRLLAL